MPGKEVIRDIRSNCACRNIDYCPLEKFVERMPERLFEQQKCVEILKWERALSNDDSGWRIAWQIWVDEGYASIFADVYQEGKKHRTLIFEINRINPLNRGAFYNL